MAANFRTPWENGLDAETRVALALASQNEPARLSVVAKRANLTKQHAAHVLEKLHVKGVVLLDEKAKLWSLQPLFYREDIGQQLYDFIIHLLKGAAPLVVNPRKDPEILMHNVQMLLRMFAVDIEEKVSG